MDFTRIKNDSVGRMQYTIDFTELEVLSHGSVRARLERVVEQYADLGCRRHSERKVVFETFNKALIKRQCRIRKKQLENLIEDGLLK